MRPFFEGKYKFCWIVLALFLFQCSMPSGGERKRVSSETKAAGGDNAQAKSKVESSDPTHEGDDTQDPTVADKDQTGSVKPSKNPDPFMPPPGENATAQPAPTPPAPAPSTPPTPGQNPTAPNGAYLVNLTCSDTMAFSVSVGIDTVSRTIVAPKSCAQLMTALDGKTFPSGTPSVEALVGGPTTKASCKEGALNFSTVGVQSGASFETALVYGLNNIQVCQEIRNVINGLNL